MIGLTFPGDREVALLNFPDPVPGPGDVIVEMKASGMCGTDLHFYRRPKGTPMSPQARLHSGPVICGHEPSGVVVEVGSAVPQTLAKVGDRVMVFHYTGCGACNSCRSGWEQMCQDAPVRVYGANDHGGHARFLRVPAIDVLPLPEELSFAAGAAISCGSGTAYGALRRLQLSGDQTIAIFGQGPVGLAATQFAKAMGARVIALDINPSRRELAKIFGADIVLDAATADAVKAIKEVTHGAGADVSLDTSGSAAGRLMALQCLKPWGKVCLVGEGGELKVDVSPDILRKQATIIGSWTFSSVIQAECARFAVDRRIDVDAIFTHRWGLDQADEAYRLFDSQSAGKGVFIF